jgi:hypothetical protein
MHGPRKALAKRIKELSEKATQVLLFLSFAMVAAVTQPDAFNQFGEPVRDTFHTMQIPDLSTFPVWLAGPEILRRVAHYLILQLPIYVGVVVHGLDLTAVSLRDRR